MDLCSTRVTWSRPGCGPKGEGTFIKRVGAEKVVTELAVFKQGGGSKDVRTTGPCDPTKPSPVETFKDLVNKKFFQTDHLLASVCDDPENFFLMFRTLNNGFDFQTKSNFKKLYTGPAWHAAVHFVRKALIMHRRYYSAQ